MGAMKDIAMQREAICNVCSITSSCYDCRMTLNVRGFDVELNGEGKIINTQRRASKSKAFLKFLMGV